MNQAVFMSMRSSGIESKDISVIIPVYNAENTIAKCLKALLESAYPIREIICVDDGSTDKTAAVIDRFCSLDNRIKL